MRTPTARFAAALLLPLLLAASAPRPARMGADERLLHLLNRLTFGPRPGDLKRLKRLGATAFIDQQLHPETIDDSACDAALKAYPILTKTSYQLSEEYPNPQKALKEGQEDPHRPREMLEQLSAAKLVRATRSQRQLEEVLLDFWFNHFNVAFNKNQDKWLLASYERDVLRPRVLGKFRDLLGAVAHSPAMLVYLDNFQSTVDARYASPEEQMMIQDMESRMAMREKGKGRRKLGLNENYARELMELHTLGVDGGYTQKDVTELARILTGWSIERPNPKNDLKDFQYVFRPRMHDPGDKVLLGQAFPSGGQEEGERALDLLARHPSTARFIALKLCRRFVADEPPPALVAKVAARFTASDGDIRETLKALFTSPEFYDPKHFRGKVKSPFEFVASALRASRAELRDPVRVAQALNAMGEPLYVCEPPTGYPDLAQPWINAGALLQRMNAALMLFGPNPNAPAHADPRAVCDEGCDGPQGKPLAVDAYVRAFLGGRIAERTRSAILERIDHPAVDQARIAALVLGSPDFQRR